MKTTEQFWAELRKGVPAGHLAVLAATDAKPKSLIPQIQYHRNMMIIQKARTPGKSTPLTLVPDFNFTLMGSRQCGKSTASMKCYSAIIQRYIQKRNWIRYQLRSKTKKGPKRKAF